MSSDKLTCGMADPARARRLSKRIATIVASAIEYEIKDPGLAGVTIVDTKVTGDLHDATVYYTVMGATLDDEPDYAGAAAALERAKGVLRSKVGARHRRAVHSDADVRPRHGVRLRAADGGVAGPGARRGRRSGAGAGGSQAGRRRRPVPCERGGAGSTGKLGHQPLDGEGRR